MDNIVWVIVASAIIIALAGVLLFLGSGTLGDVSDNVASILDREPTDNQGIDDQETDTDSTNDNGDLGGPGGDSEEDTDDEDGLGAPGIG